ncbi:MAG: hypothetical protein MZU84_09140 [Sphingobacterium sp.]|nr:hypothetical protein [Sphingobacterium sp.]
MNIKTGEGRAALVQCLDGAYESFVGFFGPKRDDIIISQRIDHGSRRIITF